ncbi:MAG: acetyl-CoA carboxylase biotin carboxyl carrier protein [bacterium]|nr:acetyl-CoA carboxylase biotin carboxyl carrier protein [bacterium]
MNIKEIREIIALMNENEVTEFTIEREGFKLCIRKAGGAGAVAAPAPAAVSAAVPAPAPAAAEAAEGQYIVSPMVGTYYAAPAPDAPPYVKVGQEVDEETVVCLIEAMKVLNEIKAERKGRIVEVLAENGEPVEFGKKLFRIA